MSTDKEENRVNDLYSFSLIRFIHNGKKRKAEAIDIVPTKWLTFDYKQSRCMTKFLDKPYREENPALLETLVKTLADAPEDWPTLAVELKGRAKNYEEALKKLNKLKKEESVSDSESEESESEIQKGIKKKKLLEEINKIRMELKSTQHFFKESESYVSETSEESSNTSSLSTNLNDSKNNSENSNLKHNDLILLNNTELCLQAAESSSLKNYEATSEVYEPPIIQIQSFENKSDFETTILTILCEIRNEIAYLRKSQEKMLGFLLEKKNGNFVKSNVDFSTKYNLILPIPDLETFKQFNLQLKENEFFRNDVCSELLTCLDKNFILTRTIVTMLKRFLTKNVALQFTAVRKARGPTLETPKAQFKCTELCRCMDAVMTGVLRSKGLIVTEKELVSALSDVLCNVKKW